MRPFVSTTKNIIVFVRVKDIKSFLKFAFPFAFYLYNWLMRHLYTSTSLQRSDSTSLQHTYDTPLLMIHLYIFLLNWWFISISLFWTDDLSLHLQQTDYTYPHLHNWLIKDLYIFSRDWWHSSSSLQQTDDTYHNLCTESMIHLYFYTTDWWYISKMEWWYIYKVRQWTDDTALHFYISMVNHIYIYK